MMATRIFLICAIDGCSAIVRQDVLTHYCADHGQLIASLAVDFRRENPDMGLGQAVERAAVLVHEEQ